MVRIQTVTTKHMVGKKLLFPIFLLITIIFFSTLTLAQSSASCPVAAYEGDLVRLNPEAFDPDPEIGPAGKLLWEFGFPFNAQGVWQTIKGNRGIFNFWVSVNDGELKDTEHTCIEVLPNNRNPILQPLDDVYITRGQNTKISATCYDPDGDMVTMNYRFNGKDVAYIMYEPPGTYDIEVICTDGFGGVDTERAKLHIDMPEPIPTPKPKPAPVILPPPKPKPVDVELKIGEPGEIELVLPKKPEAGEVEVVTPDVGVVDVVMPSCEPCPSKIGDIDVVVYNTLQDVDTTKANSSSFTVEPKPVPIPAPEPKPEPVIIDGVKPCDDDLDRKKEISKVLGCCN